MTAPVIVVGGGVAGAAAATLLARHGDTVMLIEQHREPRHKVCGEFLSTEACASLRLLGLDPLDLGAVPVRTVRVCCGRLEAESALPFPALSLTRRRLDEALLRVAASAGVELCLGRRVDALTARTEDAHHGDADVSATDPQYTLTLSDGTEHKTRTLFLATGKHDLRAWARPTVRSSRLVAFKQYFRLEPASRRALDGAVELYLFRGGYAGLQLVEDDAANLCLLIEQGQLRALGGTWQDVLDHLRREAPHLSERLRGAQPLLAQPLALSHIPYGFLAEPQEGGPWRLGDQAAVIPSFTGDGISIALHSARVGTHAYLAGESSAEAAGRLRRDLEPSMRRASALARILLTPGLRFAAVGAARLVPAILGQLALATRIPEPARQRLLDLERARHSTVAAYNGQG